MATTLEIPCILGVTTLVFYAVYFAASAAVSYGIGYLVSQLTRKQLPLAPGQQPTLSTRGSPLTLLLGRRRVAPVVCWLGVRQAKRTDENAYYKEKGMHAICLGPVDALYEIYDGGKRGLKDIGTIYRDTTPSGSSFSIEDYGSFRIYWGEQDQPVDAMLEEETGLGTRWPGVCYIVWDNKTVNPGWVWNQMEYVVERRITNSKLLDSPSWIDRTTRPVRGSIRDDGVNPAHAIWYFLTSNPPYGLGMKRRMLDGGAFEALGELCEAEHLPVNILARDGVTASQVLTELMTEVGFVLPQVGRRLVPIIVRPPGGETLPQLTIDTLIDPIPEITQQHGFTSPSRSIYLINDENNNYKPTDVTEDNDAQSRNRGAVQAKQTILNNITDRLTGYEVAQRLIQDDSVDGTSFAIRVLRGARDLQPGQLFVVPNFGTLRVATRRPLMMSTQTEIDAVLDQYGRRLHDYYPGGVGDPISRDTFPAEDDPFVSVFLVPDALNYYNGPSVWVLRVRANQGTIGAGVYLSSNGVSYHNTRVDEGHVLGGTLNRPIIFDEATTDGVFDVDVTMTPYNDDVDEIDDLSDDAVAWEAGNQIVVIGTEVFLCSRLFPLPGGYRIDGMKRAMYGTVAQTHPQGSSVWVFKVNERTTFNAGYVAPGVLLRVKTTPYTATETLPLVDATPHEVAIP